MTNDSSSNSSDETQATQLLAQILGHNIPAPVFPELQEVEKSETSMSDQSIPGVYRAPPEYHLHGLATTQTQTQSPMLSRREISQEGSGSQKENKQCASPPPATPTSPQDTETSGGVKVSSQAGRPTLSGGPQLGNVHKGGASFASPAVLITQSPQRNHTFPLPTNTRRAVSPFSQDSFARDPLVEDPGQLYLERHPQFNVTASQLQDNSHSNTSHFSTELEEAAQAGTGDQSSRPRQSGMGSSNDSYDSQRLQSQQQNQSQSMDDYYSSSQHAQQVPSQEQMTPSQVEELAGLQIDTRAMLWSQEPSQFQPPSDHPDEDEPSQYSQAPPVPYEDGVGVSGEMTQVVNEEIMEATQPIQHVTVSTIASGARPLASTVNADRLNRLRGQGVAINTEMIVHKVDPQPRPATDERSMPPPELPISTTGPLSLKRPRSPSRNQPETSLELESGLADKALSLSPPPQPKRARTSSPDIIPDSEPMYDDALPVVHSPGDMEDEGDITAQPIQDDAASAEREEVTKENSTSLDEVPESVEYSGGQSLDDDTPLAILFPPKPASPVLVPDCAPLTDPDVTAKPEAKRNTTRKTSASVARKGSTKRTTRNRAPSPDKSSSGVSTVQNSPHPEEFGDAPRPRTPSNALSEDLRLPGPSGPSRGGRGEFSRKTSRNRSAVKPAKSTPHAPTATSMSLGSVNGNIHASSSSNAPAKPRVFAYWKSDRSWYSGTIQSAEHGLYNILFDDGHTADLKLDQLRKFDLRCGDQVGWIQSGRKQSGKVHSLLGETGQETVRMDTTAHSENEGDVPLKHIKISAKAIKDRWHDRIIRAEEIVVPLSSSVAGLNSPSIRRSPSKRTTLNMADHSSMWDGFAFILSGSNLDTDTRNRIQGYIDEGDGVHFEHGLTSLYGLEGRNSNEKIDKTWIGTSADIQFKAEHQQLKSVFILSNDACQKPKFLMALALGIPCIDSKWVEESRKQKTKLDWHDFILEAGHCDTLGSRISQQVNLRWDEDSSHMQNLVFAMTLFQAMHILVIGKDFVPVATDTSSMTSQDIPRIILAMGAEEVEAVSDTNRASRPLDDYTYIVSRDGTERPNSVSWAWVKDCLVANRILPRPVSETSQNDAATSQEV